MTTDAGRPVSDDQNSLIVRQNVGRTRAFRLHQPETVSEMHPSISAAPFCFTRALRNSVLGLPALWLLRPIPVKSDGQRLSGNPFPAAILVPILQQLACACSQRPPRTLGDSGGRVLPIVLRILLGSTSDTNLSRLITVLLSLETGSVHAARLTGLLPCSSETVSVSEPSRKRTQ
jgi:hypothetical protein